MTELRKSQAMIGCPTDAEEFADKLKGVWDGMAGRQVRGDTFYWASGYNPHDHTASLPDQIKIVSTADPDTNPVFILFTNSIGSPVRLQSNAIISAWRQRLNTLGFDFIALLGEGSYKDPANPPDNRIPLTGTLFELLEAMATGEETDLVVYDLRHLVERPADDAPTWQKQQRAWLDEFLDAPAGRGFSKTHSLRRPLDENMFLDEVEQDLRRVFDLPKLDVMADELPGLAAVRAHEPLLFGRSQSTEILLNRLFVKNEQAVVVSGISGVGKSSFLRAGLMGAGFRRAPRGLATAKGATGLLVDPDLLAPPTLGDAIDIVERAQPLAALAAALAGPVKGVYKSDKHSARADADNEGATQVGPMPQSLPLTELPPDPGPDRDANLQAAMVWWTKATQHHDRPILLVLDQAERVLAQHRAAERLRCERSGAEYDETRVVLSPGWAMFLDLICRLSGLDGQTPADPRFRLIAAIHRRSALSIWPIPHTDGEPDLPPVQMIDPIVATEDWSSLIFGTFAAYGVRPEPTLLTQMAEEANTIANDYLRLSDSMPKDGKDNKISAGSVLPQVKVAMQLMLEKFRDLPERPAVLTLADFGPEASIEHAIQSLGEKAWSKWQPLVEQETGLNKRGYLEKRRLTLEMTRRFDALMRGLVDTPFFRGSVPIIELSAIRRDGTLARSQGSLVSIMEKHRLLTGAGPNAWRLPHRTLLDHWNRGLKFVEASRDRMHLKVELNFQTLLSSSEDWRKQHEDALIDLALNWVGNGEGEDSTDLENLWSFLHDRFDPTRLNIHSERRLDRLPIELLASGESDRARVLIDKVIASAGRDRPSLGILAIAASEIGSEVLLDRVLRIYRDAANYADRKSGMFPLLMASQDGHEACVRLLLDARADAGQVNRTTGTFPLLMASQNGHEACVRLLLDARADAGQVNRTTGTFPLLQASQDGHEACVRLLLDARADAGQVNRTTGTFPLLMASQNGHEACVRLLLDARADAGQVNRTTGTFPLLMASQNGHEACVRLLLDARADAGQVNRTTGTFPLLQASQDGHEACVRLLLDARADAGQVNRTTGTFPLLQASQDGHEACVRLLLDARADAGQVNRTTGTFPLLMASQNGHEACVRLLLDARADAGQVNRTTGTFPLLMASQNGHEACVRLLLDARADAGQVNRTTGTFPLLQASQDGHEACVRLLLDARADAGQVNRTTGTFPLLMASQNGHEACVRLLLDARADAGQVNRTTGTFPLLQASQDGHEACVRLLLDARADAGQVNRTTGTFPLLMASHNGHEACVRLLLDARADAGQVDPKSGMFPLLQASQDGHEACVRLLLDARADAGQVNRTTGTFPLLMASQNGHEACVRLLLGAGADAGQVHGPSGDTPLMLAMARRHKRIVRLLLDGGAKPPEGSETLIEEILNSPDIGDIADANKADKAIELRTGIQQFLWMGGVETEVSGAFIGSITSALAELDFGNHAGPLQAPMSIALSQGSSIVHFRSARLQSGESLVLDQLIWTNKSLDPIEIVPGQNVEEILYSLSYAPNPPDLRKYDVCRMVAGLCVLMQADRPRLPLPEGGVWPLQEGMGLPMSGYSDEYLRNWQRSPRPGGMTLSLPVMDGRRLMRHHVWVSTDGEIHEAKAPELLIDNCPFLPLEFFEVDGRKVGWITGRVPTENADSGKKAAPDIPDAVIDRFMKSDQFTEILSAIAQQQGHSPDIVATLTDEQKRDIARQILQQHLDAEQNRSRQV